MTTLVFNVPKDNSGYARDIVCIASYLKHSGVEIALNRIDAKDVVLSAEGKDIAGIEAIVEYLHGKHSFSAAGKPKDWLKMRTKIESDLNKEFKQLRGTFGKLDSAVLKSNYLGDMTVSVSDVMMYAALRPVMARLTKEELLATTCVVRWFNHMQHVKGLEVAPADLEYSAQMIAETLGWSTIDMPLSL